MCYFVSVLIREDNLGRVLHASLFGFFVTCYDFLHLSLPLPATEARHNLVSHFDRVTVLVLDLGHHVDSSDEKCVRPCADEVLGVSPVIIFQLRQRMGYQHLNVRCNIGTF